MKRAALLLLLAGCSKIFGLSPPHHVSDAADDAATSDAPGDVMTDAKLDIPDAAPGFCATQADCPTSVCLAATKMCASDNDVAWLSATGTAGAPCTMAQPCSRVIDALGTAKKYVRVHGVITNLTGIGQDVGFYGEAGAGFSGRLQANSGAIGFSALGFTSGGGGGGNPCLDIRGAAVTAEHVTVHDCSGAGVSYSSGALVLDGSTVKTCTGGGVAISGATFTITNNFIIGNGTNNSTAGGIGILQNTIASTNHIDFNTVVGNNVRTLGSDAGGIYCNDGSFTGVGNVIVHNEVNGSTAAATANTGGNCMYTSSTIQVSDTLGFVSTAGGNYHLTALSPLRDAAGVATGPATDVDGESRPYGSGYDIGADEYHP